MMHVQALDIIVFFNSSDGFEGDLLLWVKMLLPGVNKRVYNLQSKQLIKLFSQVKIEHRCLKEKCMVKKLVISNILQSGLVVSTLLLGCKIYYCDLW